MVRAKPAQARQHGGDVGVDGRGVKWVMDIR
jgi:hypothetical protein